MPELVPHVATIRCVINTETEVDAIVAADKLQEACMELLDEEDGDEVHVTQVTSMSSNLQPEETILVLVKARNALIRTRIKQCFHEAQELDRIIFALRRRQENEMDVVQYDYSSFISTAEAILNKGQEPLS